MKDPNDSECLPSPELVEAYRQTNFRVLDPDGKFVMTVDVPCPALKRCHDKHGVSSSLFITAWNPRSEPLPESVNKEAQTRLRDVVAERGFGVLNGLGEDPSGQWKGEPSFLVLGIDELEARQLGHEFGQYAVVFAGADAVPRLLITACPN